MGLSSEGPEKPADFIEGEVESEGSRVSSIKSKKKMEAFSSLKSPADWTNAS